MAQRPFTARMFPHLATLKLETSARGETSAPAPSGTPGPPVPCNVHLLRQDDVGRIDSDDGGATSSQAKVFVTFPADPGLVEDDLVVPVAPSPFAGRELGVINQAVPVMRGSAYRVTCTLRT